MNYRRRSSRGLRAPKARSSRLVFLPFKNCQARFSGSPSGLFSPLFLWPNGKPTNQICNNHTSRGAEGEGVLLGRGGLGCAPFRYRYLPFWVSVSFLGFWVCALLFIVPCHVPCLMSIGSVCALGVAQAAGGESQGPQRQVRSTAPASSLPKSLSSALPSTTLAMTATTAAAVPRPM